MRPPRLTLVLAWVIGLGFFLAWGTVALAVRLGVEQTFQTYLDASQAAVHGRIMGALEALEEAGGRWNRDQVADLGRQALREGLVLSVADREGRTVWSARAEDPAGVDEVFQTLEDRLKRREPWASGRWSASPHEVGGSGATMVWEVFEPRRLGAADLSFLAGVDRLLLISAAVGLALSLLLGWAAARRVVRPLDRLRATARHLAEGRYRTRVATDAGLAEVRDLETSVAGLARRLDQLQTLRETAGADTAHELRTPLANLAAQLEALEDGMLAPEPPRFAALRGEVRRLLDLVQAWEDLERARLPSAGAPGDTDPGPAARRIAEVFRPRLAARGQSLTVTEQDGGPVPLGSADLERILVNLLENAHRYSPSGAPIELLVGPGPRVAVDDRGPGVPEPEREAVFERFHRVDPSRSRESGGLGLGLALVRALARGSGGEARITASPAGGCRAEVWWPGPGCAKLV